VKIEINEVDNVKSCSIILDKIKFPLIEINEETYNKLISEWKDRAGLPTFIYFDKNNIPILIPKSNDNYEIN